MSPFTPGNGSDPQRQGNSSNFEPRNLKSGRIYIGKGDEVKCIAGSSCLHIGHHGKKGERTTFKRQFIHLLSSASSSSARSNLLARNNYKF
jgi:hypothetical protein